MAITTTSPILKQTEGEVQQWAMLGKKSPKRATIPEQWQAARRQSQKGTWQWWIPQLRMKIPGCLQVRLNVLQF